FEVCLTVPFVISFSGVRAMGGALGGRMTAGGHPRNYVRGNVLRSPFALLFSAKGRGGEKDDSVSHANPGARAWSAPAALAAGEGHEPARSRARSGELGPPSQLYRNRPRKGQSGDAVTSCGSDGPSLA